MSVFLAIFAVLKRIAYEETHHNIGHDAPAHGSCTERQDVDC